MKVGDKCLKCGKAVMALSEGYGLDTGECFHKECFKCEKCRIIITDGAFAMEGTAVYHPKCRSLAMGDVCRTCQQPIYEAVLTFKGTKFHSECFTCATCANPLSGKAFSDIDGKLLCGTCSTAYQLEKAKIQKESAAASAPAPAAVKPTVISTTGSAPPVEITTTSSSAPNEPDITCEKCKKKVSATEEKVMLNATQGFHQRCFVCFSCGKDFQDAKFSMHEGNTYHRECLQTALAPKCSKCNKAITTGFIPYKDSKLHQECFVCAGCQTQLSNKPFSEDQGQPYCTPCMEKRRVVPKPAAEEVTLCFICKKAVSDGLSLPLGRILHRACFTCPACNKQLDSTQPLAEKEGKYYHPKCVEGIDTERCSKCHKPLLGGHIPYKGKKYHEECLDCANCHVSLVGVPFVEDPDDGLLYCKPCGPTITYTETERSGGYNPYGVSTNPDVHVKKGLGTHDKCPRCDKKVFMNDQAFGPRATMWHRKCLVCDVCRKGLDASAVLVGTEIFCRDHGRGK